MLMIHNMGLLGPLGWREWEEWREWTERRKEDGRGVQQSAEDDGRERLEFCVCVKSFGRHDKSANALRLRQILKSMRMRNLGDGQRLDLGL